MKILKTIKCTILLPYLQEVKFGRGSRELGYLLWILRNCGYFIIESCTHEGLNLIIMESSREFDFEFSRCLTLAFSSSSFCGDPHIAFLKKGTSPGLWTSSAQQMFAWGKLLWQSLNFPKMLSNNFKLTLHYISIYLWANLE